MTGLTTDGVEIQRLADPEIDAPVLIEGLPGVGHVGKLAVEHLLQETESTPIRRIISEHFPPQVSVDANGTGALPAAVLHHAETDAGDVLALAGDHQSATAVGHYRLTSAVLDVAETFGVHRIFALGGMPTGAIQDDPAVVGVVSRDALRSTFEECGVVFREQEPKGGVIGISGLLLGLGAEREIDVVCLMGETSGYLVDPKSAHSTLQVLERAIGFSLDYERLEARAEEMETVVRRLREMQDTSVPGDEDLRYIG